jgi:hypothetical protein
MFIAVDMSNEFSGYGTMNETPNNSYVLDDPSMTLAIRRLKNDISEEAQKSQAKRKSSTPPISMLPILSPVGSDAPASSDTSRAIANDSSVLVSMSQPLPDAPPLAHDSCCSSVSPITSPPLAHDSSCASTPPTAITLSQVLAYTKGLRQDKE